VLALVLAAGYLLLTRQQQVAGQMDPMASATASQPGVSVPNEGQQHVPDGSPIQYRHYPPASGPHYPSPQAWGVYSTEVPEGAWVHNLEHGGVVLLYKCDGSSCADMASQIQALAQTLPRSARWNEIKFLAAPYPKMDEPFTLVAWDRQETLATLDAAKVQAFYRAYVDRGPENVP
jgi:hypothetical protein